MRKSFGETVVLDGIDLTVAAGAIFALLGPNGAGKTTMVRIRSTLIPADSGRVSVAGHDVVGNPDGIAVLDHGRIVAEGTPGELKRRIPGGHIRLHFAHPGTLNAAARLLDVALRDEENLCSRVAVASSPPTRCRPGDESSLDTSHSRP